MSKYQEAFDCMKWLTYYGEAKDMKNGYEYSTNDVDKNIAIIEKLVNKEYPRPIQEFPIVNRNNEPIVMLKHCPKCKELITNRNNYCGNCGQALDWSEE